MKSTLIRVLVIFLSIGALCFGLWSPASAQEMTCPDHTDVDIDIRPADDPNKINLVAKGLLPVAVLTTQDFDASQFAPEMAHLSDSASAMTMGCVGAVATRWKLDDVNGDGQLDLVFFFRIQDLNLTPSSIGATLMAHGSYGSTGIHIIGTDSVQVKP